MSFSLRLMAHRERVHFVTRGKEDMNELQALMLENIRKGEYPPGYQDNSQEDVLLDWKGA